MHTLIDNVIQTVEIQLSSFSQFCLPRLFFSKVQDSRNEIQHLKNFHIASVGFIYFFISSFSNASSFVLITEEILAL